ncbi:MAG TPA: hypothetical protein VIW69_06295 [Candidatus Elarobacter sp.]
MPPSPGRRSGHGRAGDHRSWAGVCPICLQQTRFTARDAWFREHLLCKTCVGVYIPRERALMLAIRELLPNWAELDIHEPTRAARHFAAAGNVRARLRRDALLARRPARNPARRIRCENLEAQTFAAGSFDLVVTQDVHGASV